MIDFNKISIPSKKTISLIRVSKESKRLSFKKKITKENKEFLKALGFKV